MSCKKNVVKKMNLTRIEPIVGKDRIIETIMNSKTIIMAGDISKECHLVPQNAFLYDQDNHTLEIFKLKNVGDKIRLVWEMEVHFPADKKEQNEVNDYLERVTIPLYDIFYYPDLNRIDPVLDTDPLYIKHLFFNLNIED